MKIKIDLNQILMFLVTLLLLTILAYTIIGTSTKVNKIKKLVPLDVKKRGWNIMRYEGYEYGSWSHDGGIVWYHVCDTINTNIQYRVKVCLFNDELQYYYGKPEFSERMQIEIKK